MAAVTTSAPELAPDVAAAAAATSARMAEAWRKAATYAPEAVFAVRAFAEVLRADTTAPFEDDAGYMFFKEAQFCINVLLRQADSQAEEQLVRGQPAPRGAAWQGAAVAGDAPDSEFKIDMVARKMRSQLEFFSVASECLAVAHDTRLAACEASDEAWVPRLVRLSDAYGLSPIERELLALNALCKAPVTMTGRRSLISSSSDWSRGAPLELRATHAAPFDITIFCEEERSHAKDGLVSVGRSYSGAATATITDEGALFLCGRPLSKAQRLKLEGTKAAAILHAEDGDSGDMHSAAAEVAEAMRSKLADAAAAQSHTLAEVGQAPLDVDGGPSRGTGGRSEDAALGAEADTQLPSVSSLIRSASQHSERVETTVERAPSDDSAAPEGGTIPLVRTMSLGDADEAELEPYKDNLSYMDDQFQMLVCAARVGKSRRDAELKEAGSSGRRNPWDPPDGSASGVNKHELAAKLRHARNKIQARLSKTISAGLPLPRLEVLCQMLKLSQFEHDVVVFLVANTVSPVVSVVFEQSGIARDRFNSGVLVRHILATFTESFKEQVAKRVYFYKSGTLLSRGIVKLHANRGRSMRPDLLESECTLDRRILDFVLGLDTEINELVEGSNLYTPTVSLKNVVLGGDTKDAILTTVTHFDAFAAFRKKAGLDDIISYGAGCCILLHGPSGTGKTMLVNALAQERGMKVLLVNWDLLSQAKTKAGGEGADLQPLFREAELQNAVLFFDECESIFAARGAGGSASLTTLLTEMEKFCGIVMLATNRPMDLDEAMHRRITAVYEIGRPDHVARREIWEVHTSHDGITLEDGVDLDDIALKYELSGGFIKNALVSALLLAISRNADEPVITDDDIRAGCRLQMRGSLRMTNFRDRVVPDAGIEEMVLPAEVRNKLAKIVAFEKARPVLFGQWKFGDSMRERQGTVVLHWGPPGTGKSMAAEALGFEVGKPLKVVSFSRLVAYAGESGSTRNPSITGMSLVDQVFHDSRLLDAVLVIDGFAMDEVMASDGGSIQSRVSDHVMSDLLYQIERYPGLVILNCTIRMDFKTTLHRIHPDFLRRVRFIVEFDMPNKAQRAEMWKRSLPDNVPVHGKINYSELAERFGKFNGGTIATAVYRAAAAAALRTGLGKSAEDSGGQGGAGGAASSLLTGPRAVTMDDLIAAGTAEADKEESEVKDIYARMFM